MCNPVVIPIAIAAGAAIVKGYGAYASAQSEGQAARAAEASARYQQRDALERGADAAGEARTEGTRVAGAQRAATAANGVELSSGSASTLFSTTSLLAEEDAATARANASREAWGHAYEAETARYQQKVARRKSVLGPLTAGLGFASDAYAMKG